MKSLKRIQISDNYFTNGDLSDGLNGWSGWNQSSINLLSENGKNFIRVKNQTIGFGIYQYIELEPGYYVIGCQTRWDFSEAENTYHTGLKVRFRNDRLRTFDDNHISVNYTEFTNRFHNYDPPNCDYSTYKLRSLPRVENEFQVSAVCFKNIGHFKGYIGFQQNVRNTAAQFDYTNFFLVKLDNFIPILGIIVHFPEVMEYNGEKTANRIKSKLRRRCSLSLRPIEIYQEPKWDIFTIKDLQESFHRVYGYSSTYEMESDRYIKDDKKRITSPTQAITTHPDFSKIESVRDNGFQYDLSLNSVNTNRHWINLVNQHFANKYVFQLGQLLASKEKPWEIDESHLTVKGIEDNGKLDFLKQYLIILKNLTGIASIVIPGIADSISNLGEAEFSVFDYEFDKVIETIKKSGWIPVRLEDIWKFYERIVSELF
ncbi:MAG: hypothetical protein ACTSRP_02090 [Candidatus Helarchaeota archaeon]